MERRDFLKSAAAATAGAATVVAQAAETKAKAEKLLPGDIVIERPGSDFMVDVIKTLGFDYVATNPGPSFRSLHESIVNYGGNRKPELLTCLHEESAVGMAHGYAKASGKPMGVMTHGTVGLQHASMALYNAWCDRVPVYMIVGNGLVAMSEVEAMHARLAAALPVTAIKVCYHSQDEGCRCRKPAPGMLLGSADTLQLVHERSAAQPGGRSPSPDGRSHSRPT